MSLQKKHKGYEDYEEVIPGMVVIYKRKSSKSQNYYVRMSFPGRKGYERQSLETPDRYAAIEHARKRYWDLRARYEQGFTVGNHSITSLFEEFFEFKRGLGGNPSQYEKVYNRFFKTYWTKEVQNKDIGDITQSDMDGCWDYRIHFWDNAKPEKIKDKRGRNRHRYINWKSQQGKTPAWTTLEIEKACYNSFFKWAISRGFLKAGGDPIVTNPIKRVDGKTWKLRGWFTVDEYRLVRKEIEDGCRRARKKKRQGNGPRRVWHAERMRAAFYLVSAFGVRPSELHLIRWKWIKLIEDTNGNQYSIIVLPGEATKRKAIGSQEGRTVFSFDGRASYDRLQGRWWKHCEPQGYTQDDLVFAAWNDPTKKVALGNCFMRLLQRMGIHRDEQGRGRNLYSLRKFYIDQRIKHGTPLPALAKNTGHDVQTLWKWYQHVQTEDMFEYLVARLPQTALKEWRVLDDEEE